MHPLSLILLFTAFINFLFATYTLKYYKASGAMAYFAVLICIAIYALGYVMEINSTNLNDIYFWLKIEYIGIAFFPTFQLILAIQYTGHSNIAKWWLFLLMFAFSLSTMLLEQFNFGKLFYTNFSVIEEQGYTFSNFQKGIWYWIHQAYSNIALFAGFLLYLSMAIKQYGINRIRASIMLISLVIPWSFYIFYLSPAYKSNLDLIPLSFSIVGIMGGLGLFRFKLLDFEPLALGVVFDSMEDGVIIIDKRFRLANFNPAASKIFAEINTSKLATNLEPWIRKWVGDETTLLCREPKSMDITLFEGKKHYYLKASPVFENQDRLAGWTLIFSDITIRIENEEKLKENARELAELIATKDKFMAIVAHDLRNPFTLLITLTDILVDNIEEKKYDTAIKDAKILRDTSRNTYQLLQNLLMWSQIQRNGIKFIPNEIVLKPIAENELEPIHLLAQQKKIQIITQIQDDIKVFADEQMLRTILRNILTNAVKYSFADKQVILTSSTIEEGVLIEIKDSGVGLSQEDINKLFKIETSFSKSGTAREKGTGLGLLLCQEFISLHQGKIWVESELGKGSTFKIMFPFKATNG